MSVGGVGGSSPLQSMQGLAGVGIQTMNMANQAQTDMMEPLLSMMGGQTGAKSSVEAKGMLVDTYA